MEIETFNLTTPDKRDNGYLFPNNLRALIIGKSNCGKTTLLFNILLKQLDFDNLIIYSNTLHQPAYQILLNNDGDREHFLRLFQGKTSFNVGQNINKTFGTEKDIIPPESNGKSLVVFDDLEHFTKSQIYFTHGRHSSYDSIMITQNYFNLPRKTIRENANFICLFKQDLKNINHLYNDHVSCDMTKKEFLSLCHEGWKEPNGFITIDMSSKCSAGRYRLGLSLFYTPISYCSGKVSDLRYNVD